MPISVKKSFLVAKVTTLKLWDEKIWNEQLDNLDELSKKEQIPIEISQLSL